MFYHAVHLLNYTVAKAGAFDLHEAQYCSLAGDRDAGVVCNCASRAKSCPEPSIVGTTQGFGVRLPKLGDRASVAAFMQSHPNLAYLVSSLSLRSLKSIQTPSLCLTFTYKLCSTTLPRSKEE
eukprot:763289-Hanusia_phi.AAC.2